MNERISFSISENLIALNAENVLLKNLSNLELLNSMFLPRKAAALIPLPTPYTIGVINKDSAPNFVLFINFLNASGFLDIPFNKKSSLQIAARRSLNDLVQTPTYTRYFQRITQQTELEDTATQEVNNNEAFRFYDTALRWLYKPTSKDQLRVNFLLINNLLSFDETLTIENTTTSRKSSISQNSIAAGIFYERQWHSNLKTEISLYETDYKLQAINANIIENQRFLQENKVSETSIKLKNTYNKKRLNLITGYQFVESEITNLNDIDVPRFVRLNSRVIREHALFLQATYKDPSNIITLKPGLRYNYITKFKTSLLEPRLVINTQVTPRLQLLLKGEFKHQNSSIFHIFNIHFNTKMELLLNYISKFTK